MAHNHSVSDTDRHFSINPITKLISSEPGQKTSLVQYDKRSEIFTFRLPRYVESHDMLQTTDLRVYFRNGKTTGYANIYNLALDSQDSSKVSFSWLLNDDATQEVGDLSMQIRFACYTGDETDYVWSTAIYQGVKVLPALFPEYVNPSDEPIIPDEPTEETLEETAILGVGVLGEMILGYGG